MEPTTKDKIALSEDFASPSRNLDLFIWQEIFGERLGQSEINSTYHDVDGISHDNPVEYEDDWESVPAFSADRIAAFTLLSAFSQCQFTIDNKIDYCSVSVLALEAGKYGNAHGKAKEFPFLVCLAVAKLNGWKK